MKTYRIEFDGGCFSILFSMIVITLLCVSIVGLPIAIATLPTMYRIVEDSDVS